MPVARYDALLIYVIVVQVAFVVLRLETWRELCVICAFHLIGLALEVFKVHAGSWSYPDAGAVRIAGVPVFSGFMYASVGSYICQAFRRFDLRVGEVHPRRFGQGAFAEAGRFGSASQTFQPREEAHCRFLSSLPGFQRFSG